MFVISNEGDEKQRSDARNAYILVEDKRLLQTPETETGFLITPSLSESSTFLPKFSRNDQLINLKATRQGWPPALVWELGTIPINSNRFLRYEININEVTIEIKQAGFSIEDPPEWEGSNYVNLWIKNNSEVEKSVEIIGSLPFDQQMPSYITIKIGDQSARTFITRVDNKNKTFQIDTPPNP